MTIIARTAPKFCAHIRAVLPEMFFPDLISLVISGTIEPWPECQPEACAPMDLQDRGPEKLRGKLWNAEGSHPYGPERQGENSGMPRGPFSLWAATADLCPGTRYPGIYTYIYIYKGNIGKIRFCTIWELGGSRCAQNTPTGSRNHFHTRQAQF